MNARERMARSRQPVRVGGYFVSTGTSTGDPVKFLDPWFQRDAAYAYKTIPWNPLDWFDAKITRDVAANGGARVDAMIDAVNARATEIAEKRIAPVRYNAAAFALLGGSQDIGAELASSAKGFLDIEANARAAGKGRISLAGSIAGSFIGMPWLGTILGGYYDWMEKEIIAPLIAAYGGAAGHSDWIVDWYKLVTSCFSEMMRKMMVPPFGGTLNFGSLDWEEWQNVKFQTDIVCGYREKWNRMPDGELEPVHSWFAVLAKYPRDETVARMIMHTTWNPQGLAGDSQVLVAAAPIARLYGFDLREFAAALWDKSDGWRARKDLTHVGDDGTIVDAGVVQWVVLCRDAFDLAAEWRSAGKGGIKYTIERMGEIAVAASSEVKAETKATVASTNAKLGVTGRSKLIYALGLGAAAASWWFTAPLAVPLAILGTTWYVARRRARTRVGGHTHSVGCGCKREEEVP